MHDGSSRSAPQLRAGQSRRLLSGPVLSVGRQTLESGVGLTVAKRMKVSS